MSHWKRRIKTRAAPPRPHGGDVEVLRFAAGAIAATAFDGCGDRAAWFPDGQDLSVIEIAAQIAEVLEAGDDGTTLARKLARRFGWFPDPRLVERLAATPCYLAESLKVLVARWVKDYHVEIPFPLRTPVEARLSAGGARAPGTVARLRRETAEVAVVIRADSGYEERWLPVEALEARE